MYNLHIYSEYINSMDKYGNFIQRGQTPLQKGLSPFAEIVRIVSKSFFSLILFLLYAAGYRPLYPPDY